MSINAKTQSLFFVFVAVWAAFVVDQSFAFNARILTKQFIPNSVGLDQIIRSPSSSSSDYKTKVSTISSKSPNTKTKKNTSQQLHGEYVIGGAGSISTTTVTATQPPLPLPTIDTNTKGLVLPKFVGNVCSILRIDVDKIANVGVSFALTYSIISNINGSISLSLAWYISSNQTGLSPLAPGQWKSLLAAYGGLYAFITLLRPLRVMTAAALSKKTTTLIDMTQDRFGCSRTTAIVVLYAMGFVAWMTTLGCGISLASACSGVPIW